MRNLKNILRMTAVALAAVVVTACSDKGSGGEGDGSGMTLNSAWSVTYAGAGTVDGVEYKHTAAVVSTDDNPYTLVTVYADEYDVTKLQAFGEVLIEDMYSYLNSYNYANGTSYVLNDLLDRGSSFVALGDLAPGDYICLAIGITPEGELSGLYAKSATFHIGEDAPTASYSAWLGNWVLNGDNNVSNNITIERKVANREIYLKGIMNLPFSIVGEYSTDRDDIIFSSQVVTENYDFGSGKVGDVYLIGLDEEGKVYPLDNDSYGIAIAGVLDGGQRAIVRYGVNVTSYPKFVAMMLVANVDGQYYSLDKKDGTAIPAFNIMATIDSPSASTLSAEGVSVGRDGNFAELQLGREITHIAR